MPNKLNLITREHLINAFNAIDLKEVPKNNEWNLYWINYQGKLYPFKYTVELASKQTNSPLDTLEFRSTEGYRRHIASLGFPIQYRRPVQDYTEPQFWIAASYYGREPHQENKFDDFIKEGYWRTDHDLSSKIGRQLDKLLKKVRINDRIAIRYFSRKNSTVDIAALGTITAIDEIENGKLSVTWDYAPRLYKGEKPSGEGAGNWWNTFIQLKRREDIELIFDYSTTNKRASRLTWNTNGYVAPSGYLGKSKDKKTHEGRYGFGHEEWLFENSRIIGGYHYGFLEPIRKHQDAYTGKTYDVWLYTLDGLEKRRYAVGEILGLEVIGEEKAIEIESEYRRAGWLLEMEEQLRLCGADEKAFTKTHGVDLFNIRYLPENLKSYDPFFELPEAHPVSEVSRYSFLFEKESFTLPEPDDADDFTYQIPVKITSPSSKDPRTTHGKREPRQFEMVLLHKTISEHLTAKLRVKYGDSNVHPEHPAFIGQNRVDIVVNAPEGLIFYEIKTYNSLMTSIREAIGQLLEYALWPNKMNAKKMVVISQSKASSKAIAYFSHLRKITNLPIYYQSYDHYSDVLSQEY